MTSGAIYEGVPTLSCRKGSETSGNLEAKPKSINFNTSEPFC